MIEATTIKTKGDVEIICEWEDGTKKSFEIRNTILKVGRQALAKSLANELGDTYDFYITRMLFGDGGTSGGVKKFVDAGRTGLFGVARLSKPVVSSIDPSVPEQVILTSVIAFDELVGVAINEMALQMANGDLYSLTTFPDLSKTENMQITFNWRLNFI